MNTDCRLFSMFFTLFSFIPGKYEEMTSKSGHSGGGESQGMDPNAAMLEKEHEEITKVT